MSGRGLLALCSCVALCCASPALADPSNTSPPQLSDGAGGPTGTLGLNTTLSLSTGSWTSSSSDPLSYDYQWQSCSYPNAVLADGPIAYYRLGEPAGSTAAVDVSGFAQAPAAATSSQAGAGGAIAGDDDGGYAFPYVQWHTGLHYITATGDQFAPADFSSGASPASIEAWVDPSGLPHADGFVAGFGSDAYGESSLNLELYTSGGSTRVAAFDGVRRYIATDGSIAVGQWYHLALTFDGTTIRLYLNGTLAGTFAEQSTFSLIPEVARIDASVPKSTIVDSFGGTIDDVAFYGDALGATAVLNHYTAGKNAAAGARCADVPGATGPSFTVTPDLSGTRIRGQMTAVDGVGSTSAWSSEFPVGGSVVVPETPDLTGAPESGPTLVSGTVVDASGNPVAGARVSVYADLPTRTGVRLPLLAERYTDGGGNYSIAYDGTGRPVANLYVAARSTSGVAAAYLGREWDDASGTWLDDSGALSAPMLLTLPAATDAPTPLTGPGRAGACCPPCPSPSKTLVATQTAPAAIAELHTWTSEKAQLFFSFGSTTTISSAASFRPNNFVNTGATATISDGYNVGASYPVVGANFHAVGTSAVQMAEYKYGATLCSPRVKYQVEPYKFIGGTTGWRSVDGTADGHCPTRLTPNSISYVPGSTFFRQNGTGYSYTNGITVFGVGLTTRTDWNRSTTEEWWPQKPGGGARLWVCGDTSTPYWYNAKRIFQGPWTS